LFQLGVLEVDGGDLQGVEHEAGGFVVELAGGQEAHDFGEGELDGIRVLENGKTEGGVAAVAGAVGVEFEALFVLALVVVAETVVAHDGRSALGARHHDAETLVGQTGHEGITLILPVVL
jgi:hypothetical protein